MERLVPISPPERNPPWVRFLSLVAAVAITMFIAYPFLKTAALMPSYWQIAANHASTIVVAEVIGTATKR